MALRLRQLVLRLAAAGCEAAMNSFHLGAHGHCRQTERPRACLNEGKSVRSKDNKVLNQRVHSAGDQCAAVLGQQAIALLR